MLVAKGAAGKPTGAKRGRPRKYPLPAESSQAVESAKGPYGTRAVSRSATPGISITVQIPALRRPKLAKQKDGVARQSIHRRLLASSMVFVVLVAGIGFAAYTHKSTHKSPAVTVASAKRTTPDYNPLVPSAEKASAPRFDADRNMVSYTTTFSGSRITVSQQALPANFATDPTAMQKAADGIKATQQITTNVGTIYIVTNDKDGDQRALFSDKNLLLFIHADRKLDDVSWKSFVELLTDKTWQDLSKNKGA